MYGQTIMKKQRTNFVIPRNNNNFNRDLKTIFSLLFFLTKQYLQNYLTFMMD